MEPINSDLLTQSLIQRALESGMEDERILWMKELLNKDIDPALIQDIYAKSNKTLADRVQVICDHVG